MGTDMPTNHWLDSFTSTKLIHHPVTASSGVQRAVDGDDRAIARQPCRTVHPAALLRGRVRGHEERLASEDAALERPDHPAGRARLHGDALRGGHHRPHLRADRLARLQVSPRNREARSVPYLDVHGADATDESLVGAVTVTSALARSCLARQGSARIDAWSRHCRPPSRPLAARVAQGVRSGRTSRCPTAAVLAPAPGSGSV